MENPWGDERDDEPRPMSPSDVSSSNSQRPYVMSEASREQTRQWMKLHDAEMEVRQRTRKWTRAEEDKLLSLPDCHGHKRQAVLDPNMPSRERVLTAWAMDMLEPDPESGDYAEMDVEDGVGIHCAVPVWSLLKALMHMERARNDPEGCNCLDATYFMTNGCSCRKDHFIKSGMRHFVCNQCSKCCRCGGFFGLCGTVSTMCVALPCRCCRQLKCLLGQTSLACLCQPRFCKLCMDPAGPYCTCVAAGLDGSFMH